MYEKVHLGYRDGIAFPAATSSAPMFGNIISAKISGVDVLHLWPLELPLNAVTADSTPLATLWRAHLSGVLQVEFGLTGYECRSAGQRPRWLLQRWFVFPMDHSSAVRGMQAREGDRRRG